MSLPSLNIVITYLLTEISHLQKDEAWTLWYVPRQRRRLLVLYSCLKFLPQISTADTVNGLYGLSAAMTAGEGEWNVEDFVLTHLNKKMANSALVQTYRLRHATRINATVKVSRIILKLNLSYFTFPGTVPPDLPHF